MWRDGGIADLTTVSMSRQKRTTRAPGHNLVDWVGLRNIYSGVGPVARGGRHHAASCRRGAHG
jgi:hypothetical protein